MRSAATLEKLLLLRSLLLVLFAASYFSLTSSLAQRELNRLTCVEVMQLSDQYVAGELDEKTVEQIHQHLEHCPNCRERMAQMQNGASLPPTDTPGANRTDPKSGPVEVSRDRQAVGFSVALAGR